MEHLSRIEAQFELGVHWMSADDTHQNLHTIGEGPKRGSLLLWLSPGGVVFVGEQADLLQFVFPEVVVRDDD